MDKYFIIGYFLLFTVLISKTYGREEGEPQDRDTGYLFFDRRIVAIKNEGNHICFLGKFKFTTKNRVPEDLLKSQEYTYVKVQCDKSSSYKTILVQNGWPGRNCRYTIKPNNSYVCQIRIDIDVLYLMDPNPQTGKCSAKLTISGLKDFELCGLITLSHVYVSLNNKRDNVELEFNVGNTYMPISIWKLRVTQLQCPSMLNYEMSRTIDNLMLTRIFNDGYWIAPTGCLQYYPDPSGPSIQSFNYEGGSYLPNMNYAICFRRTIGNTKLTLTGEIHLDRAGTNPFDPYDDECLDIEVRTGDVQDYLFIPEAKNERDGIRTRHCGYQPSVKIESSPPGPFVIYFHSDGFFDQDFKGFKFEYNIT